MCVIGNKVDLREGKPEGSCVTTAHGEKLAMVKRPTTYIYSTVLCTLALAHVGELALGVVTVHVGMYLWLVFSIVIGYCFFCLFVLLLF